MKQVTLFFLCSICIYETALPQTLGDYRTRGTNTLTNWSATTAWQYFSGTSWRDTTSTPSSTDGIITIQSGDSVVLNTTNILDQVIVNGVLILSGNSSTVITIVNGSGVDLQVIGTLIESKTSGSVVFASSATWSLGSSATFIKTTSTSSNVWQSSYASGASSMPATANWIIRKNSSDNPTLSSIGAYYPNLTIENYTTSQWVTSTGSIFSGASGIPTILGSLDIGGSGTNTVNFSNTNTNASLIPIVGNCTIHSGSVLNNSGTGLQVSGMVTLGGKVTGSGIIKMTNTTPSALSGYGATAYISGTLIRSVTSTGTYDFPIGSTSNYELAQVTITSSTGLSSITAKFTPRINGSSPSFILNGSYVDHILDAGYWSMSATAGSTATYDVTLTERGHTNGQSLTTQHCIMKRTDSTSLWGGPSSSTYGFHSNATQSGTGISPVTAKRTSIPSLGDFAIGYSPIEVLPIERITLYGTTVGETLTLYWENESSLRSDSVFSVEHSSDGITFENFCFTSTESYKLPALKTLHYYRVRRNTATSNVYGCLGGSTETDIFTIQKNILISNASGTITFYNTLGQFVMTQTISVGETLSLPEATRIIVFSKNTGEQFVKKVF